MTAGAATGAFPVWAVLPAAGVGRRLPGPAPKQYRRLAGRTVLEHSLARVLEHPAVQAVMVVTSAQDDYFGDCELAADARVFRCDGGAERADSVLAGLRALQGIKPTPAATDAVLVHDAARALLPREALQRLLAEPPGTDGALLAWPSQDTLKCSEDGQRVARSLDRTAVWQAQTPQLFEFAALEQALAQALEAGLAITDEASCMEWLGRHPRLVLGDARNFKITTPGDLAMAGALLESTCE